MIVIDNTVFTVTTLDIIQELVSVLRANGSNLISKYFETESDIMVCCPYHKDGQERRPSAGIRKSDGMFHCLACGETHTLTEVISHCLGFNDVLGIQGYKWLIRNFSTVSVENRKPIELNMSRDNVKKTVEYVSEEELDNYRYYHPYMWERKLTPEIVEIFDIGYDKDTQCITFPVRDITGGTLFVARRSVNTKYFNYPKDAIKPLYGLYELSQLKEFPKKLIVTESMLDATSCWVYGKPAVALNGLGNELQFEQLRSLPCRQIILATDNDVAGLQARKRIRANVKNKLISEYAFPKSVKDINDLTKVQFENLTEFF